MASLTEVYYTEGEAAYHNHEGRILYLQGQIHAAIPHFEAALRYNPHLWEVHYNLAHSLVKINAFEPAILHYQNVITLYPLHPKATFHLGLLYIQTQHYVEAIPYLHSTLEADPYNLDAAHQLANAYLNTGDLTKAKSGYHQTLTLNPIMPQIAEIHHNLAILYLRENNQTLALSHFTEALDLDPQNDTARHMMMALQGNLSLEAPSDYVANLFNQYASYYNQHMRETLQYQVPGLLRNALGRTLGSHTKACRIVDLGCGTGLCGLYFRDMALELIGVDLSAEMIAQAEMLDGCYDALIISDIHTYLNSEGLAPFDLILAGDVLVYTGNLEIIFTNVMKCLGPKGHFAFTIEHLEDDNASFYLQPTGRYAHSTHYIETLAHKHQFNILLEEHITPRLHNANPVKGKLYILFHK
jgi:predicted TPR repeat methyltransferase